MTAVTFVTPQLDKIPTLKVSSLATESIMINKDPDPFLGSSLPLSNFSIPLFWDYGKVNPSSLFFLKGGGGWGGGGGASNYGLVKHVLNWHQILTGHHQHGRHRLEYLKSSKVPSNKSSIDCRIFISSHQKVCHFQLKVLLKVQGEWPRWLNYIQQNFSWKSLPAMPVNLSLFFILSTYDTLPSPSNLKKWKLITEAFCFLSNKICGVLHLTFLVHVKLL